MNDDPLESSSPPRVTLSTDDKGKIDSWDISEAGFVERVPREFSSRDLLPTDSRILP